MSVHGRRRGQGQKPSSDLPVSDAAGTQPDPLLKSGTFIESTVANGGGGAGARARRGVSENPAMVTPVKEHATEGTDSPVESGRRARKRASEPSSTLIASDSTNWLPPGWRVEDRVRNSGATAGLVDKYYVDPVHGHRFRSKKEVFYFLETGSKRKKTKGSTDADTKSPVTPKSKKSGSKGESAAAAAAVAAAALQFDHADVPEGVRWVLTDAATGTWTPFIGDEQVPESKRIEWAAAFQSLSER